MSYSKAAILISGEQAAALTNIECALIAILEKLYPEEDCNMGIFEVPSSSRLLEMIDDLAAIQKLVPSESYEKWCIEDHICDGEPPF